TQVEMTEVGDNLVRVTGARGLPPTSTYKVSTTFQDGYRNQALLVIGGIDAAAKARRTAETVLARTRKMFAARNLGDYSETRIETVGAEDMFGANATADPREVVMKLAVRHESKDALNIFAREFAPAGTSMSPGTMGFGGGRPSPGPVVRMFSFLAEKSQVPATVVVGDQTFPSDVASQGGFTASASLSTQAVAAEPVLGEAVSVPLIRLCYGRSGDKGNTANVGLIARRADYLPVLRAQVTCERVQAHFAHVCKGEVERFDLPGIGGMNFVLHEALGGGGMASLNTDNLAKAYAQVLMSMEIDVPAGWAAELAA
ncbi:MAG: acyclic terpene utilization AtuA family protein, partial [Alphaproteobacteria bacterium]|nr:acyclic terpene utilization AtuA family protein [Alphaproteobacteria bacterium]